MLPLSSHFAIFLIRLVCKEAVQSGNRLVYLDAYTDPYYPSSRFPKLVTTQWIGESGVEAVVIFSDDDLGTRRPFPEKILRIQRKQTFLDPVLSRLHRIDGRQPISLMANSAPEPTKLANLVRKGWSIETHSQDHACPQLEGDFCKTKQQFHACVDNVAKVPGNYPVAFRFPCMDAINSVSPRFLAEVFNSCSRQGHTLRIDTSIGQVFTAEDTSLPRKWTGKERFSRYVNTSVYYDSSKLYTNFVRNYPYPYIINPGIWEFPIAFPDDWSGAMHNGKRSNKTIEDMKIGLDAVVQKQGVYTFVFHTHAGWISQRMLLEFVNHAVATYGDKVKFLNFQEAADRLERNLLLGQPLRRFAGRACIGYNNGVRLLDLNNDGFLDIVIGNDQVRKTRLWLPRAKQWQDSTFPTDLRGPSVRFGILDSTVVMLQLSPSSHQGWRWSEGEWQLDTGLTAGLEGVHAVLATGIDAGLRLRDVNGDGQCEIIIANEMHHQVFFYSCSFSGCHWAASSLQWPPHVWIVDARGLDGGLRFVDLNRDTFDDILFSNAENYSITLWNAVAGDGWSSTVFAGARGSSWFPMIVRSDGSNNGAWFDNIDGRMLLQNECVKYDYCSFDQLMLLNCSMAPCPAKTCPALSRLDKSKHGRSDMMPQSKQGGLDSLGPLENSFGAATVVLQNGTQLRTANIALQNGTQFGTAKIALQNGTGSAKAFAGLLCIAISASCCGLHLLRYWRGSPPATSQHAPRTNLLVAGIALAIFGAFCGMAFDWDAVSRSFNYISLHDVER
jgi:hypothetical protein